METEISSIILVTLTSPDSKSCKFRYVMKYGPVTVAEQARRPGSWVRIPLRAWMFDMCVRFSVFCVVLCLGRGLATS
jgi:hypothetical protein